MPGESLSTFLLGDGVELHGPRGTPQHNGRRGVVCGVDVAKGRYRVQLPGTTNLISIKPANLIASDLPLPGRERKSEAAGATAAAAAEAKIPVPDPASPRVLVDQAIRYIEQRAVTHAFLRRLTDRRVSAQLRAECSVATIGYLRGKVAEMERRLGGRATRRRPLAGTR